MHVWIEQLDLELNEKEIVSQTKDPHKANEYQEYFKLAQKILFELRGSPNRTVQKIQSVYLYNCDKCNIEFSSWNKRRAHMIEVHSV